MASEQSSYSPAEWPVARLLSTAQTHDNPRIRALGEQVSAKVDALRSAVIEFERDRLARDRIAQLEAELADLRRLTGKPVRSGARSGANAEIRKWAAAQGLPVPARGRLPGHIIDAYDSRPN